MSALLRQKRISPGATGLKQAASRKSQASRTTRLRMRLSFSLICPLDESKQDELEVYLLLCDHGAARSCKSAQSLSIQTDTWSVKICTKRVSLPCQTQGDDPQAQTAPVEPKDFLCYSHYQLHCTPLCFSHTSYFNVTQSLVLLQRRSTG